MIEILTVGEIAQINRRRLGKTQQEMAELHDVPQSTISDWENGKAVVPPALLVDPFPLMELEELRLLRRRAGLTINEAAARLGLSHVTVIGMEKGTVDGTPLRRLIKEILVQ